MPYRLVSASGEMTFELRPGAPLVLGRALSSDLPVLDPTVSRRHAEVAVESSGVTLRDLGSSNGTFVNGNRITTARVVPGDRLIFGKVLFELRELSPVLIDDATAEGMRRAARAGTTIVRQIPVPDADQALENALRLSGVQKAVDETTTILPQSERDRLRLTLLLEISKALTRATDVDQMLEKLTQFSFRLLDVDRVTILLLRPDGELEPSVSRLRAGAQSVRGISLALARTAIEKQVAILSDDSEPKANGEALGRSSKTPAAGGRTAACAPLVAGEGRVLGVLYVDSVTSNYRISEEDLDFLVAFAGIAAVAVDNVRYAERVRHESTVRANFERFFAPALAARIAASPDAVRLGGERRSVAVLFSDIRGFTQLAAQMTPDETASLLTEYFTEMVECVFRHGGTLDKFIGDAVMAQWGAPISEADDADRALDAALDMMRCVERLNEGWRQQQRPEIQVGIGLSYGEAFAGFLGSDRRLEYTLIGDTVNTGNRICRAAEGGEILVSDAFRTALTRPRALLQRDPLSLQGKTDPVPVYRASQ
ncbi:MAG: adenylate/guanylate cyclase domain-containing protein [Gemmatimonadaceae bacterium]